MNIAEVHTAAVGLMPVSRPLLPGYDSGVLAMIVVSFLLHQWDSRLRRASGISFSRI